jgi:hypothetical protein
MMNRKLLKIAFTIFSTMFLSASLFGQNAGVTEMTSNGASINWRISVPFESATLTVSAPNGQVYSRQFKGGSTPTFTPVNSRGEYFGDGQFTFELTLAPVISAATKQALAQSRIDGNGDEVAASLRKRGMLPQAFVVSGSFRLDNGQIIVPGSSDKEPESSLRSEIKDPTTKSPDTDIPTDSAIVVAQDQIVQGSQCVGIDCSASETFGFDTLRLKENNLRIKFDDTSNSGSFPSNDWQLTANDSANGGANKFSIDDVTNSRTPFTVEANAPSNSLYVDSTGRIGLGTNVPVVEIHSKNGDTPTLRLEQDGSSGFTAQTWDIAGNETNFFVRDQTSGSRLPLRIQVGSESGSLIVGTGGNVGIGFNTSSGSFPSNPLEVKEGTTALATVKTTGELELPKSGGGIRFPDGTLQTTAATGSGFGEINTASNIGTSGVGVFNSKVGTDLQFRKLKAGSNVSITATGNNEVEISSSAVKPLGASYATTIFGGTGQVSQTSTVTPTTDTNNFGTGVSGAGYASYLYGIPTNANLAEPTGTQVVFKIRYRDSDGTATATSVNLFLVQINATNGARTLTTLLNSNTNSGTGFQTVTVCQPASIFNFSGFGYHLGSALVSAAGTNADLVFVQIYKSTSCP